MQQLADSMQAFSKLHDHDVLIAAAQAWASHALATYRGDLLRAALEVSVAMANFISELEDKPAHE